MRITDGSRVSGNLYVFGLITLHTIRYQKGSTLRRLLKNIENYVYTDFCRVTGQ